MFLLYCIESGVFLVLVPWTSVWRDNYFLGQWPAANRFFMNNFAKGAVSGLGLVLIVMGFQEVVGMVRERNRTRE